MSNFGLLNLTPYCQQLCSNGISMRQNLRVALDCLLVNGVIEKFLVERVNVAILNPGVAKAFLRGEVA